MNTYYNENDQETAAWLRELIRSGLISKGKVDDRSITEVKPADLAGVRRAHFFAGVGGWDYALRLAGWPDDRPIWTGSCSCQPFSVAGRRRGFTDPRDLWPIWFPLIAERRPPTIVGEQVGGKDGEVWLDRVFADMEGIGYACAAFDLPAAGVGAPDIRQRIYWVADDAKDGRGKKREDGRRGLPRSAKAGERFRSENGCDVGGIPNATGGEAGRISERGLPAMSGPGGARLGHSKRRRQTGESRRRTGGQLAYGFCGLGVWDAPFFRGADGKARRLKPGIEPLVDGLPRGVVPSGDPGAPGYAENTAEARVLRLSGYGNAIVPQLAAEFLMAVMESTK